MYVPAPHDPHELAPVEGKKLPGEQTEQEVEPELLLKDPRPHNIHSLAPAKEYVPGGHKKELLDPPITTYEPGEAL
jgi:hypothetical protein